MTDYIRLEHGKMLSKHLSHNEVIAVSQLDYIDAKLPAIFELVRHFSGGRPIRVNDAGRASWPSASYHLTAQALDLGLDNGQLSTLQDNFAEFLYHATREGLRGFGTYRTHVHIDTGATGVTNIEGQKFPLRYWAEPGTSRWDVPLVNYSVLGYAFGVIILFLILLNSRL